MTDAILLIDDDESLRRVTEYNLAGAGFTVITAESGKEGLRRFRKEVPGLVITDVKLGDMNGLEVLAAVKKESPDTPVIVITAFGSIEMAVKAMQQGAFTFITKPFDRETLRLSCEKALELKKLRAKTRLLSEEVNRLTGTEGMETANSAMAEVLMTALKVASSEATVLITGESGTGKEVLARLIHQNSPRKIGPMVAGLGHQERPLSERFRRHPVPGRGGRLESGYAGQTATGHPGKGSGAGRFRPPGKD